jgi:uncharacterized protein YmfQ (DUF2313 family)
MSVITAGLCGLPEPWMTGKSAMAREEEVMDAETRQGWSTTRESTI